MLKWYHEPLFKPSVKKGLFSYLIIYFGVSSILMVFLTIIISIFDKNHSFFEVLTILQMKEESLTNIQKPIYYNINTYTNFLTYLVSFVVVGFFMRDSLVSDFISVKNKKLFYGLFAGISAVLFWGISILVSNIVANFVGESDNQNMIVGMITQGGAIPIFFAVVVFAPFVEELVYRKAIFKLLEKKHVLISYLVSTIVFVVPHMISTPIDNIGNWLLLCIPYFVSAILLCLIYHKSNKNFYVVWFVHMINNLFSFIVIMLG